MNQKGMTILELLMVIFIIGIVVSIGLLNYQQVQSRAKETQIKANAHSIQIVAESYAVLWGGAYPAKKTGTEMTRLSTFRDIESPFDTKIVCQKDADCGLDSVPNSALIVYNNKIPLPNSFMYSGSIVYSGRDKYGNHTETSGLAESYLIKGSKKAGADSQNSYIAEFELTHSVKE